MGKHLQLPVQTLKCLEVDSGNEVCMVSHVDHIEEVIKKTQL